MSEVTLNASNFEEEVLKSDKPVLVDFWASWCGPCKMMSPVVAQIAEEEADKVKVGKVNIDDEQELAVKYGVMSIPAFMVFKNGEVVASSVGVQPKASLLNMI
ncbi:MAG: thioredoxin [Butyrivibrio sp.]|nr:thioredoxin [Butyrivibrio sp.]